MEFRKKKKKAVIRKNSLLTLQKKKIIDKKNYYYLVFYLKGHILSAIIINIKLFFNVVYCCVIVIEATLSFCHYLT